MKISRRDFLGAVTGSAATLLSFQYPGLDRPGPQPDREFDCAVLDLQSHCVLRESLQGYQAALIGQQNHLPKACPDARCHCRMAIVPGLGPMDPALAQTLSDLLNAGTDLLLESGAGFLSPAEFAAQQKMLHRYFNLTVEPPVHLWSGKSADATFFSHRPRQQHKRKLDSSGLSAYVDYVWPRETKVRDFSRVIPVSSQAGDVIGRAGVLPVALKKCMGKGVLIFLGSPLGPALRAGDPEAQCWLQLVTALSLHPARRTDQRQLRYLGSDYQ